MIITHRDRVMVTPHPSRTKDTVTYRAGNRVAYTGRTVHYYYDVIVEVTVWFCFTRSVFYHLNSRKFQFRAELIILYIIIIITRHRVALTMTHVGFFYDVSVQTAVLTINLAKSYFVFLLRISCRGDT